MLKYCSVNVLIALIFYPLIIAVVAMHIYIYAWGQVIINGTFSTLSKAINWVPVTYMIPCGDVISQNFPATMPKSMRN